MTGGHADIAGAAPMSDILERIDPAVRSVLIVDLGALRTNYRKLRDLQAPGECAGVVKANGYGLGLEQVAKSLAAEGCGTFFVATLQEALSLRQLLPDAHSLQLSHPDAAIYVLDGLMPGQGEQLAAANLRPVLGSIEELRDWAQFCTNAGHKYPCAIHIDTGMNRLGLSPSEVPELAAQTDLFAQLKLALIVTHLVSGEERDNPLTLKQASLFDELRALLPDAPTSFANSAGIQLCAGPDGNRYHYDIARPGVALYGAHVFAGAPNPMRAVVALYARVLKVRDIKAGETIGYNATWRARHPLRAATLGYGYADGYLRALSAADDQPGLPVYFGDAPAPVLGRVSMDYITVDVTGISEDQVKRGDFAEVIGPHVTIDDVAKRTRTNSYEILTSLGRRSQRIYLGESKRA